jgi:hypothetical protein
VGAPSVGDRLRDRRRGSRSGCAGDDTHAHNTLSARSPDVQVFYPFHPLHGTTLQILRRPERGDGAVCVIDAVGKRLKIPVWMLSRACTEVKITERPHLCKEALLSLASLIILQLESKDHVHDNLLQTAVDGCKGGRRGATTTSGPDDSKGMRGGADGRSDTHRSDRSHGPRSGGGLSRGGRKNR